MGHEEGILKSKKLHVWSYLVVATSSLLLFYLWMGESSKVGDSLVFNTDAVLQRDSSLVYHNRSGYSYTRPNFTNIDQSPYHLPTEVHENNFTVVILTHNRTKILLRTLRHYANMSKVDRIVVLWNNQGVDPPPLQTMLGDRVQIVIKILPENKLRLRYQPLPEVRTQALFNLDDDMLVSKEDVYRAFEVWKLNPYTAVGFFARAYTQSLIGWSKYQYKMEKLNGANYSIILVDVAFLHKEYFRLYTETLPKGMASLVDRLNNCEDIAMSFLISNLCKCASGLHVEPRQEIVHLSGKKGLSGKSSHPRNRGRCISSYSKHFAQMPLKNTNCVYY